MAAGHDFETRVWTGEESAGEPLQRVRAYRVLVGGDCCGDKYVS